jgi:hypothetical protein
MTPGLLMSQRHQNKIPARVETTQGGDDEPMTPSLTVYLSWKYSRVIRTRVGWFDREPPLAVYIHLAVRQSLINRGLGILETNGVDAHVATVGWS